MADEVRRVCEGVGRWLCRTALTQNITFISVKLFYDNTSVFFVIVKAIAQLVDSAMGIDHLPTVLKCFFFCRGFYDEIICSVISFYRLHGDYFMCCGEES